ncbi:MAG: cation diffusion facilitator family transporter [Melioribacteraceae bacterium]|nr:cation diffusion facilitator family transporter [Melioribacteraceae bacterium]
MNKRDKNSQKRFAATVSLIVGLGMFAAKMSAYLITGSSAIFSDAAESVVHIIATSMALYSIILSSKPADRSHLYGHGNIEYFSAGMEGLLIIIAALAIIYTSVKDIIIGAIPQQLNTGTIIVGIAGVINFILGYYLIREGKKNNSIVLIADGKHVLTDSFTSIGVVVGLVLVLFTDIYILDPIFALLVAFNIIFSGIKLMRESIGGLMNETDENVLNRLIELMSKNKEDYWIDIHNLRFWTSAEKLFVDFHLILPHYFTIKRTHEEDDKITAIIEKVNPDSEVRIHLDYCNSSLCKYCKYADCRVRMEEFSKNTIWDENKLIGTAIGSH